MFDIFGIRAKDRGRDSARPVSHLRRRVSHHRPKPAVQKLFNKTIAALCKKCPDMTIVVTAGNHDSGTRIPVQIQVNQNPQSSSSTIDIVPHL